jgi:hypothetical protein
MKKLLSISLALIMMALSLRMTVAVHYCDNEIANASIGFGHPDDMGCGMEESEPCSYPTFGKLSCCSDQVSQLSVDHEYSPAPEVPLEINFLAVLPTFQAYDAFIDSSVYLNTFFYRPPPDLSAVSLSFVQVFII